MSVKYDFSGKRILVTGGAGDLGKATVKMFLDAGASVVVLDKDEQAINELRKQHPTVEAIAVDLKDWQATIQAVSKVIPIHHLVNNAGVAGPAASFLELQPNQIDTAVDVNIKALICVSQAVAKGMIEAKVGGTIVNVSSIMSKITAKKLTLYSATKAAVLMLTKTMALELAEHDIRVNCISPTMMQTKMTMPASLKDEQPKVSRLMQRIVDNQIVKRFLTTDETADLILYLSSSSSSMIVGENVLIDGGLHCT